MLTTTLSTRFRSSTIIRASRLYAARSMHTPDMVYTNEKHDQSRIFSVASLLEYPSYTHRMRLKASEMMVAAALSIGIELSQQTKPNDINEISSWKLAHELGSGSYGVVHYATCADTGDTAAIKVIELNDQNKSSLTREIDVLKSVRARGGHNNIISLRGVYQSEQKLHIVTELMRGGEMYTHLAAYGAMTELQTRLLTRDVCNALGFLHDCGIIHKDIKPENILLMEPDNSDNNTAKIADFGSAGPATAIMPHDHIGTSAYQSPEYVLSGICSPATDMWALGCVLYIALCGSHPFDLDGTATDEEIEKRVHIQKVRFDYEPWTQVSDEAKDLIRFLLHTDPKFRPSAAQVLQHVWMRDVV
uniref:Cleavageassociated kinase putative n=1 Tax=Albugo laibachii Nc14 TaxID=890382 RepID=F0W840_9STRA|nr:cleavageassociated kinase putative [Albugo laibachii Nc14]|eukprot:CCA17323.1 cleavageassociated kinase putative [Albugo laibachii Nc14]